MTPPYHFANTFPEKAPEILASPGIKNCVDIAPLLLN